MSGKSNKSPLISRRLDCPGCGSRFTIPLLWTSGVESVFRCRQCGAAFGTGYRMGAALFALAFVLAVGTVNILCYIVGSRTLMVMFFAAFPLWLLYGFILRKAWLLRRARKNIARKRK